MERIAVLSDVHANKTALEAVLQDIENRNIKRIFCLGDSIAKGVHPVEVIEMLRKKCEIILIGNTDYNVTNPKIRDRKFWTTEKIGEELADYIYNLPRMHQFYMSGQLVRLFHATPFDLDGIYNPMYNKSNTPVKTILNDASKMFENTDFLGLRYDSKEPDIIGYGHIHTPLIVKYENKTIFNTGSVGIPVEMRNTDEFNAKNKFSTVASYMILEGEYESTEHSNISFTQARVVYDIEKEIKDLEMSDMPNKSYIIKTLKTAIS